MQALLYILIGGALAALKLSLGRDEAEEVAEAIEERYDVALTMYGPDYGNEYEPGIVILSAIVVPPDKRGTGIGRAVMEDVTRWADERGYMIALTPSSDFGGSVPKLRKFYKSLGFVRNLGRAKDFRTREAMVRYPRKIS